MGSRKAGAAVSLTRRSVAGNWLGLGSGSKRYVNGAAIRGLGGYQKTLAGVAVTVHPALGGTVRGIWCGVAGAGATANDSEAAHLSTRAT
jgi:hypothetical protein